MERESINVILVDDIQNVIVGIELFLSQYDYINIIGTYNNGLEVLNSEKLGAVDLILMDIEMPVMNGFETAKRISYRNPEIKLVAVTMYEHQLYLTDIVKAGFHGFVEKGKIAENLMKVIGDVMENKRAYPNKLKI